MDSWTASPWVIFMSLCMGVGAFVILKIADKVASKRHVPKEMSDHYPELERVYLAIVTKNRELLEVVREATEVRKELPAEYQAILDQVLMLARLVENASFEQAATEGVVPRRWFGGEITEKPSVPLPLPAASEEAPPDSSPRPRGENVVAFPSREWINGQLLLKSGS
jgi:hypothetical protein